MIDLDSLYNRVRLYCLRHPRLNAVVKFETDQQLEDKLAESYGRMVIDRQGDHAYITPDGKLWITSTHSDKRPDTQKWCVSWHLQPPNDWGFKTFNHTYYPTLLEALIGGAPHPFPEYDREREREREVERQRRKADTLQRNAALSGR